MITFNEFKDDNSLNEGLIDSIINFFKNIIKLFDTPAKVDKAVSDVMAQEAEKGKTTIDPKSIKLQDTVMIKMGAKGKNSFVISLTKMADLPGGAGLFQISGTTSEDMLKSLTKTTENSNLSTQSVMVILTPKSVTKGKTATMKILKNIVDGGKDYVTTTLVEGIVSGKDVESNIKTQK